MKNLSNAQPNPNDSPPVTINDNDLAFHEKNTGNQQLSEYSYISKPGPGNFSEAVVRFGGSWSFIIIVLSLLIIWVVINTKIWSAL
jgi:uncharacterized membrane protein